MHEGASSTVMYVQPLLKIKLLPRPDQSQQRILQPACFKAKEVQGMPHS